MGSDDLINIDGEEKNIKEKDVKKYLIYGAVGFLIFVVAVIGFAIYQNSSKEDNAILPPEVNKPKEKEDIFKQLPIENLSQNSINETNQNVETKPIQSSIQKPIQNSVKEKNITSQSTLTPQPKPVVKKKDVKPNDFYKETKIVKPSKEIIKKKEISKIIKNRNYYIQVAALMKYSKPNKRFLNLIKKYGYNYIFYPVYIEKNGKKIKITKILIGPFTKKEAKNNLEKIKKYIASNAFIYKVKR